MFQVLACLGIFWLDLKGLGKMARGLLEFALPGQCNAELVVRLGIVGSDLEGLGKMTHGFLEIPLLG
jgi:hypothetical protein